jgi:cation diffusion facilitator CzcD-associated flavoprotein CzcO
MKREFGQDVNTNGRGTNGTSPEITDVDVLIAGSGFSGCHLLYKLRKLGFNVKIAEAGSDLGGIWHWNTYPGARVDSQYPVYSLSIPEVYESWTWTQQYPVISPYRFTHDSVTNMI